MMMMILILIVKEHISTQDIDRRWTLRISIIRIENLEEALFFCGLARHDRSLFYNLSMFSSMLTSMFYNSCFY